MPRAPAWCGGKARLASEASGWEIRPRMVLGLAEELEAET